MSRTLLLLSLVVLLTSASAHTSPEPDVELRGRLRKLFEACQTRALVTGSFPQAYRALEGFVSASLRRQFPEGVQFLDPENEENRLRRRSPIGERTPCLRVAVDGRWLNVACTGWIYESDLYWESNFVDLLPRPFSDPRLLRKDVRAMPERAAPRSPRCGFNQVDLARRCNVIPTGPWFYGPIMEEIGPEFGNWLESGICELDGVLFDVRGAIQVDGKIVPEGQGPRNFRSYPVEVKDIPVGAPARRLHLLLGTVGTAPANAVVAWLHLRFAGEAAEKIPLRYGGHFSSAEDPQPAAGRLHPGAGQKPGLYSLHRLMLPSPRPGEKIRALDFISGGTNSHPFLLAITLEP
jgi:hypothetical protein